MEKMAEVKELSVFQRNLNSLTLYLYLMNTECKNLEDYDNDGEFETHNYFFNLCRTKLKDKIEGDSNLLINQPLFMSFFDKKEDEKNKQNLFYRILLKLQKKIHTFKAKEEEQEYLRKTYFEYSNSLSKSKFRNKAYNFIAWSIVALIFIALVAGAFIFTQIKTYLKIGNLPLFSILLLISFFLFLIIALMFLKDGISIRCVLKQKKITKTKFKYMYSDDYCYSRINEAETFFRTHYNVENDYLELSEAEKKYPKEDNFFYKTIMETKNLTERNKIKLLTYNDSIFCRAVFSELFMDVQKDGVQKGNLQQIPFVFRACQMKAKLRDGNTGFAECINHLLGKSAYTDTTFNQAMSKLKDPESEICPKYLAILRKNENI